MKPAAATESEGEEGPIAWLAELGNFVCFSSTNNSTFESTRVRLSDSAGERPEGSRGWALQKCRIPEDPKSSPVELHNSEKRRIAALAVDGTLYGASRILVPECLLHLFVIRRVVPSHVEFPWHATVETT
jgi:hypothetical protein